MTQPLSHGIYILASLTIIPITLLFFADMLYGKIGHKPNKKYAMIPFPPDKSLNVWRHYQQETTSFKSDQRECWFVAMQGSLCNI